MQIGFYGKLPSHGDFLRRRAPDAFVAVIDPWLQECMTASRIALGDRWLEVYLTSPVWRFAAAAGACGPSPVLGLLVPSVDRVGRYFPLTVVADLPAHVDVLSAMGASHTFFEQAEALLIETLETEHVDFERFDEDVQQLGDHLAALAVPPGVVLEPAALAMLANDSAPAWQVPLDGAGSARTFFDQLLSQRLAQTHGPCVLWWTEGSNLVDPSCLVTRGLPSPERFPAMLDGSWRQCRWQAPQARVVRALDDDLTGSSVTRLVSDARTDVGNVRSVNQDSFLDRPESGLWVVADGMGGHRDGGHASRMICDALADVDLPGGFEDAIDEIRTRIVAVNDHLVREAEQTMHGEKSGSTVVVLFARGSRRAVVWAGDSRAYLWRNGRLEQLTRDHSFSAPGANGTLVQTNAITRAVGAQPELDLDVLRGEICAADRYLLCSDGLTRVVPETEIARWMAHEDLKGAVDALITATLQGGAPDNVTVLMMEARA